MAEEKIKIPFQGSSSADVAYRLSGEKEPSEDIGGEGREEKKDKNRSGFKLYFSIPILDRTPL